MPERVNNRTIGEKILIWSLIIFGVIALLVGSYAIVKSIKVTKIQTKTAVSAQDVERIGNAIMNRLDSLHSTSTKRDSIQSDMLNEIRCSVNSTNKELKNIEKRLIRVDKK